MGSGFLGYPNFQSDTDAFVFYSDLIDQNLAAKSVLYKIENDVRAQQLIGKMISTGGGALVYGHKRLAMWRLWLENEQGKATADAALDRFLNANTNQVLQTLWLNGIVLDSQIELEDGYLLLPIQQMPRSVHREIFEKNDLSFYDPTTKPRAAVVKEISVSRDSDPRSPPNDPAAFEASKKMHDIAMMLNALPDTSCTPGLQSSYGILCPFGIFSGSSGGNAVYDVSNVVQSRIEPSTVPLLKSLLRKQLELSNEEKLRIDRVLLRLAQAKRRQQIDDKLLDFGIALEMLLLGGKNQGSISFTFKLRGSWLLGSNPQDRARIFNHLHKLYGYRSDVAHNGFLGNGKAEKVEEARKQTPVFQDLAERTLQRIILGGNPDWTSLILGGTT